MKTTLLRFGPVLAVCAAVVLSSCQQRVANDDFRAGMESYEAGNFDEAIAAWSRHLRRNPGDARVYGHRAEAKSAKGDNEGAIVDFDHALDLDPEIAAVWFGRGKAAIREKAGGRALACFNKAIELEPDLADARFCRGNLRGDQGDVDGAIADYDRVIELDPSYPHACLNRGAAFYLRGDWLRAGADFDSAGNQKKPDEYAWLYSCVVKMRLGQGDAARKELQARLSRRKAGKPGEWFSILGSFLTGGLGEDALMDAAGAGGTGPARNKQCEASYFAGMLHLIGGRKDEAVQRFRNCLDDRTSRYYEHVFARAELLALGELEPTESGTPVRPGEGDRR